MCSAKVVCFFAIVFIAISAASAQSNLSRSESELPANPLFTSDLVGWTEMQMPKPAQSVSPEPPDKTASDQANTSDDRQANSQVQTFAGTIVEEGNTYILRTSDKWSYDLDDQATAAQYLNQRVAITGTLNASGDLIHIHDIQPVS
jgi:Protein of unknown function (DUF5818)